MNDLTAERRWCLTGTPVQNGLNDLFSLTKFLRLHPFDQDSSIRKYIHGPLQKNDQKGLDNLRFMMKAYSLRRVKDSYLSIKKYERTIPVVLSQDEKQRYKATQTFAATSFSDPQKSSHVILKGILGLRQICSHGSVILQAGSEPDEPLAADSFQADIGGGTTVQSEFCLQQLDPFATDYFGKPIYNPTLLPLSYQGGNNLSSAESIEGFPCGPGTHDNFYQNYQITESHMIHRLSSKLKKVISCLVELDAISLMDSALPEKRCVPQ